MKPTGIIDSWGRRGESWLVLATNLAVDAIDWLARILIVVGEIRGTQGSAEGESG